MSDSFRIGVREFQSRLMVGTGKYANDQLAIDAIRESGADIVTMATVSYTHLTLPTTEWV